MKTVNTIVHMIFVAIKVSIHTYIFPGYKSFQMLAFAFALFVLSLSSELLGWPHLVDWRGAGIGTIILFVLYIISRKEINQDDQD